MILLSVSSVLASCVKWVDPDTTGRRIAERIVPVAASSTSIYVAKDKDAVWTVSPSEDWLKVNFDGFVKGEYAVTVSCGSNESTPGRRNFARMGYVYVMSYDHVQCDTIVIKQRGITPVISMEDVMVSASQQSCLIPLETNLNDEQRPSVTFTCDRDWVSAMEIAPDNAHVSVLFSGTPSGEAKLTMCYNPVWGDPASGSCSITIKQ